MNTANILLILVTIIAVSIILLLLGRSRATRGRLRALNDMTRKMLAGANQGRIPPEGKVDELSEALELLAVRIKTLEGDLGWEREKAAAILSTISAGVLILSKEKRVVMLNDTGKKLFKASCENATGRPFIELARDDEMDE